jgi:hypothetical protein
MHAEDIKGRTVVTSDDGLHCAGIGSRRVEDSFRVLLCSPAGTGF